MEAMYRSIIEIDRNVSKEELEEITRTISAAFRNRAGTIENKSKDPFVFIFEGIDEPGWSCLMLGDLEVAKNKQIFEAIADWQWIDENDPNENEDEKKSYIELDKECGWWK